MNYHAVPSPEHQAGGDSKRESLCQQGFERVTKTTSGASSSRRPVATEDLSSEKKGHLHPNTEGEKHVKKFDDVAKNFEPQSEERARILQSNIKQFLCKIW